MNTQLAYQIAYGIIMTARGCSVASNLKLIHYINKVNGGYCVEDAWVHLIDSLQCELMIL